MNARLLLRPKFSERVINDIYAVYLGLDCQKKRIKKIEKCDDEGCDETSAFRYSDYVGRECSTMTMAKSTICFSSLSRSNVVIFVDLPGWFGVDMG